MFAASMRPPEFTGGNATLKQVYGAVEAELQ